MYKHLPCLPLIQERFINTIKNKLPEDERKKPMEIEMTMFPQLWGSTALGFGGFGGQSMTTAYTTIVHDIINGWYGVFFDERLAYCVQEPNEVFFEDMRKQQMKDVMHVSDYK